MKKLTLALMVVFSVATVNSFATDTKPKAKKTMKCAAGANCCKKMSKASAAEKAKCAKACADKSKKAA